MMSLTQINRRKSCVNIPLSKIGAHEHKYNCGLSVRANRTSDETTVIGVINNKNIQVLFYEASTVLRSITKARLGDAKSVTKAVQQQN